MCTQRRRVDGRKKSLQRPSVLDGRHSQNGRLIERLVEQARLALRVGCDDLATRSLTESWDTGTSWRQGAL